jgi:hypothetical protein
MCRKINVRDTKKEECGVPRKTWNKPYSIMAIKIPLEKYA